MTFFFDKNKKNKKKSTKYSIIFFQYKTYERDKNHEPRN